MLTTKCWIALNLTSMLQNLRQQNFLGEVMSLLHPGGEQTIH